MRTGIKRVTIELSSGAQIVMAPEFKSLPIQFVMPGVSGRIGEVIEISADELIKLLADLIREKSNG